MRKAVLLLAIFCAWVRPLEGSLRGYDDAYYARKALEVVRTGDWLGLPFNGSPTFDNPPLGIWAQSLSFLCLGISDAAARFPSGVYGLLTVMVLYSWAQRRLRSPEAAFYCSAVFLCNPLYLKYLRRGMLDTGCLFWSVLGVWLAERKPLSRPMQFFSGVAFGAAFLTKSALALAVPAAILIGWLWEGAEGKWRLRSWLLPASTGFSAVVGAWLGATYLIYGEAFVRGHFIWLLWERGVQGMADSSRLGTLIDLFVALLPASLLMLASLPGAVRVARSGSAESRLALAWAIIPGAILMAIGSRKLWYFMAALPGVAAVSALGLARWTEGKPAVRRALLGGVAAVLLAGAGLILALPVPVQRDRTGEVRAAAVELRERTAPGTAVWIYFPGQGCRWESRNELLWYADRPIEGCTGERAELPSAASGERTWILTTLAGTEEMRGAGGQVSLWFRRGELALLSLDPG